MSNQIPHQYLNKYIKQSSAPGFCVLLTGPWGAGKTYFIRSFQESHKDDTEFLYITLNGVQSTDQINDEFYRQLNPRLSGENASIASALLKQGVKAGTKIEIDNNITKLIKSKLIKHSKHILIFDDLERCEMPLEELLGFLNKLVEHNSAKIVLIANELELIRRHPNYPEIKEKLIGVTLELETSPIEVIRNAASATSQKLNELIQHAAPSIIEIFERSDYRNLRHIKQSFLNFDISFGGLDQEYYRKSDLIERLLYVYLIISIEIKAGRLLPAQIGSLLTSSMSYAIRRSSDSSIEVPQSQKIIKKYSSRFFGDRVLTDDFWEKIFTKGYLPRDEIVEAINKSAYYRDTSLPNWMKLWHLYQITDAEFNRLLTLVKAQFDNSEINTLPETLHITGLLLRLSSEGLISASKASIIEKANKIILKLKASNQLPDRSPIQSHGMYFDNSGGLEFMEKETDEFRSLVKFSIQMISEQYEDSLPAKINSIVNKINDSEASDFLELYSLITDQLNPYENIPILHLSDAKLFGITITRRNETIMPICTALHDRYKSNRCSENLEKELDWIKELRDELRNQEKMIDRTLSKSIIRSAIKHQLDPAISELEKKSTRP